MFTFSYRAGDTSRRVTTGPTGPTGHDGPDGSRRVSDGSADGSADGSRRVRRARRITQQITMINHYVHSATMCTLVLSCVISYYRTSTPLSLTNKHPTYESATSYIQSATSYIQSATSYMRIRDVLHTNPRRPTYKSATSYIRICDVLHTNLRRPTNPRASFLNICIYK